LGVAVGSSGLGVAVGASTLGSGVAVGASVLAHAAANTPAAATVERRRNSLRVILDMVSSSALNPLPTRQCQETVVLKQKKFLEHLLSLESSLGKSEEPLRTDYLTNKHHRRR
jgi:hypothetical protein